MKTALSVFAFIRLQISANFDEIEINGYQTNFRMLYDQWMASCQYLGSQSNCCLFTYDREYFKLGKF